MFSVMAGDLDAVRPTEEVAITLASPTIVERLAARAGSSELLYIVSTSASCCFSEFTVHVDDSNGNAGLQGTARGEPLDAARHKARRGDQGRHLARPEGRADRATAGWRR